MTNARSRAVGQHVRKFGGWSHMCWSVKGPTGRAPGGRAEAFEAIQRDLKLVRSKAPVPRTLTRIASSKVVLFPGVYRNPYNSPAVTDLRRLGLFVHATSLRLNIKRRGLRPQAVLLVPDQHVEDQLLGADFPDLLNRHGFAVRVVARPPWNPAYVGLLLCSADDALLRHIISGSPGYVAPACLTRSRSPTRKVPSEAEPS